MAGSIGGRHSVVGKAAAIPIPAEALAPVSAGHNRLIGQIPDIGPKSQMCVCLCVFWQITSSCAFEQQICSSRTPGAAASSAQRCRTHW